MTKIAPVIFDRYELTFHKYILLFTMYQVSFWEEQSFYAPQDFIVVGAGLAGLWTALELRLAMPAATITIVERGNIPMGASTRNAGFACFGSPSEMISDAKAMGEDAMWSIAEMRYKGIEKIRNYFPAKSIDFDDCGGYECFETKQQVDAISTNLHWLNKGMKAITGIDASFNWNDEKLASSGFTGFAGMMENRMEGGLHSGKLVQALLQLAASKSINILYCADVIGWHDDGKSIHVATPHKELQCKNLVLATNAFLPMLASDSKIVPARGQVLVTAPIQGLRVQGTFHFDEGYYYFRNVGDRVLLGGARKTSFDAERTTEFATTAKVQQELERFLSTHILPITSYTIAHRWSGIMAFTENKLPQVKQLQRNVWSITCCNGMGVALTPIIAEKLVQQITGSFNEPLFPSSLHLPATL